MRWATVVSKPPQVIWVEPYLSQNRTGFRIPMEPVDEARIVEADPEEGTMPVEWSIPEVDWIAVDDLDEGFDLVVGDDANGVRLGAKAIDTETDHGLPLQEFGPPPGDWSRATSGMTGGPPFRSMVIGWGPSTAAGSSAEGSGRPKTATASSRARRAITVR